MRLRSFPIPLMALFALAACDPGGTGSEPGGEYRAILESPNGADGAAAVELTGAGIESITGDSATVHSLAGGGTTRLVVLREPAGRLAFRITMAQGQAPPSARVVEVADGGDRPRASLDGYRVTFKRSGGAR